jgi:hypothetical protein
VDATRHADEAIAAATRGQRYSAMVLARGVAARIAQADGRDEDVKAHVAAVRAIDPAALSARAKSVLVELGR